VTKALLKFALVLAVASPLSFGQYSYFINDTTMAGPPSSLWTTSNGDGTDMVSGRTTYGGEVKGVYVSGNPYSFQMYLASYDCYSGCSEGSATNFTTGYALGIGTRFGGNYVSLGSTWLNPSSGTTESFSLTTATIPTLNNGDVIRAVCRPDATSGIDIIVYVNNSLVLFYNDTNSLAFIGGAIGFDFPFGGSADTYVSAGYAGLLYTGAPTAIPASSISSSAFTNQVDLSWPASTEPSGIGIYGYRVYRNGVLLTTTTSLSYEDLTVGPSQSYTYTIQAIDYHWNTTSTNITVNTPYVPHGPTPSATPNGFRTGVQPTGAYWGGGNENIDVMSGNVSFSLPLLQAQSRTNWSVPFSLSYNSQDWRQDSGGAWGLSGDVGYGFGWKLLAGSIAPIWSGSSISLYIFTDSTGAEYRLDQNSGTIWSSVDSVYVYFDSSSDTLHFRDGSFWKMGSTSSAGELDSGVMYPTTMEDSNGNQIIVVYEKGSGSTVTNTSSRIESIQDVRGGTSNTFSFTYNTDSPYPHLTSISNSIGTAESYSFSYAENQPIISPINSQSFGETAFLNSATVSGVGVVTSFTYDGSGEMTQAILPYGGYLKWDYDTVEYSSGISFREVHHRYLSKDGTSGSQTTYTFAHESPVSAVIHQYTTIADPGGVGQKYWAFGQSGVGMGLVSVYEGNQLPGPVTKTQNNFTWSLDSVGNSYISSTLTTLDPGQSYQAQSQTTQSVDSYGNVLQVNNYNYGNLTTPARTTTYTYLNSSAYTSLYIFNRLATASVTNGTSTVTLATNTYDSGWSSVSDPTSNWDTSYASVSTRGNLYQSVTPNNTSIYTYNQMGVAQTVMSNGVTTTVTTSNSNNYAAPTQLSVGSLTSSLNWTSFLGLSSATGPNGDTTSTYYDSFARPSSTTSAYGATTSYTYSTAPYSASNPATTKATVNGRWTLTTLDVLDGRSWSNRAMELPR
jgi:hypothetical protein